MGKTNKTGHIYSFTTAALCTAVLSMFILSTGCMIRKVNAEELIQQSDAETPVPEIIADQDAPVFTDWEELSEAKPPVLLSITGDIMAHTINFEMKDYNAIYEGVKDIFLQDDLTFANLEFPIYTEKPMSSFPLFNVHPSYVQAAIDSGIEVFSMSNNHTTDKGPDGAIASYEEMQNFARTSEVWFSGIRKDTTIPFTPTLIEKKGWKIGFYATTQWLNTYWGGEHACYLHYQEPGVKEEFFAMLDRETPKYDLFILSFHGGVEYAQVPSDVKMAFFDECLEHGVDILWSQHTHMLQPWYAELSPDGGKAIFYSAGNFISGQGHYNSPYQPDHHRAGTGDGVIFQVWLHDVDGKSVIRSIEPVLFSNLYDPEQNGMVVRTYTDLINDEEVPAQWKKFYTRREFLMTRHMANPADPHLVR